MNRDEILNCLREHRAEIGKRFAVARLGLFGSAAWLTDKTRKILIILEIKKGMR